MNAEAKNMEAISRAVDQHNADCPFPPFAIKMHPLEIERMGWEAGDVIRGLRLEEEPNMQTGTFVLVCAGTEPPEIEEVDAVGVEEGVHA